MNKEEKNAFLPVNFENWNAIEEIIKNNPAFLEKKVNFEDLEIDLNEKILLHPIYTSLWTLKARYKYIFGSKENGKSFQSALRLVTRWLSHPKRNCIVLRRYASYNANSTLPDIIKVMNLLAKITGIRQFSPVSAEDYRRSGKKELFYYTKTAPIELHNSQTKQKIIFTGLDRVGAGGLSLESTEHAIDTVWAEELVDLDEGTSEVMDDSTFSQWLIIESTLFRGTRKGVYNSDGSPVIDEKTGRPKQVKREGLEWVDEEVIFSYNSHNPDHWLLREIGDRYVPLNPLDEEDCLRMRDSVVRAYYDPEYQGGEGIFVMRTSVYLNDGADFNRVEQLRKDNPKEYSYLYLGATKAIGGLAYSGYENRIHIEKRDLRKYVPISIGIDHANSVEHGDWFAASFLATDLGNEGNNPNDWAYPIFNEKYYYDEVAWNNKELGFKDDKELARMVIEKIRDYVEEYPNFKSYFCNHNIPIIVDSSAGSFMQTLWGEIIDWGERNILDREWLGNLKVVPVEGKNTMQIIDGVKQKARKARVERNKRLLSEDMIVIDPAAYRTRKEFMLTSYDKNGEVVDKHRDFVDAMDYAEMFAPITNRFNYVLLKRENSRKKRANI